MSRWLLIASGGALGAMLRYLVVLSAQGLANGWTFPIGTFIVNTSGCLLIGFLTGLSDARAVLSGDARQFLLIGCLGGYTTFSSFGYETFQLLKDGEIMLATINTSVQVVVAIGCVWLGQVIAKAL